MSEKDGIYQQLRSHMAQLKLTASAEVLAGHIDTSAAASSTPERERRADPNRWGILTITSEESR